MSQEKISILITNFNKEKFLEECILSCLKQNYENLEIIIIDNLSTDDSLKIIQKYSSKLIIKTRNRNSIYGPKNQIDSLVEAFNISNGEIILLLDSDDYILANKVSKIKNILNNNPNVDVIFDAPFVLTKSGPKVLKLRKKLNDKIWPTTVPTSGISLRRTFFEHCLKSNLFQDYPVLEVDFRINFFAQKILNNHKIINENLSFYRKTNNGVMSQIKFLSHKWWIKRLYAHYFINDLYIKYKIPYDKGYDFYLTKVLVYLLNNKT
jgi:glycosyltransferase involved in cell wall biosynthesis